jgi:hypothetical protein
MRNSTTQAMPWDEADEEVRAIRRNKRLMARLDEYVERARRGPTKSLAELRKQLGIPGKKKAK